MVYPVMLEDMEGALCVVVGGGKVAARKARALAESGAGVLVISPELCPALRCMVEEGRVRWEARPYREGDLRGARIAFAASDSRLVNAAVASEARGLGIEVNVADSAPESSFTVPASLVRGEMVISVGTGGGSPALARLVRDSLAEIIGPEYGGLLEVASELRRAVQSGVQDEEERLRLLNTLTEEMYLRFLEGGVSAARAFLGAFLSEREPDRQE